MDFENRPGKMKEYGISIEGEWDVELLKSELEEQVVHLLPQEQINFGFMNGYGGILISVCRISIHATESHIELIGSAFSATLGLKLSLT